MCRRGFTVAQYGSVLKPVKVYWITPHSIVVVADSMLDKQ